MPTAAREGLAGRVSTAVEVANAPKQMKPAQIANKLLADQIEQVKLALPTHLKGSAESFVRAGQSLVSQTPKLAECDHLTILGGLIVASQLGLQLGPLGGAYLVPYGRTAQLIIGYKGLIDLAWRSNRLRSIEAREVHQGDEFEYAYGLEPVLVHKPTLAENRGPVIAYYGLATFKDDGGSSRGSHFVVLSKADVNAHRKRSRSSSNGPWVTDYDAMAKKTCIRVMQPYLPLTTEVMHDMALDGAVSRASTADQARKGDGIDFPDVIDSEPFPDDEPADEPQSSYPTSDPPGPVPPPAAPARSRARAAAPARSRARAAAPPAETRTEANVDLDTGEVLPDRAAGLHLAWRQLTPAQQREASIVRTNAKLPNSDGWETATDAEYEALVEIIERAKSGDPGPVAP